MKSCTSFFFSFPGIQTDNFTASIGVDCCLLKPVAQRCETNCDIDTESETECDDAEDVSMYDPEDDCVEDEDFK
jgi:hypothetical protein